MDKTKLEILIEGEGGGIFETALKIISINITKNTKKNIIV